jgi:hypothetical protein
MPIFDVEGWINRHKTEKPKKESEENTAEPVEVKLSQDELRERADFQVTAEVRANKKPWHEINYDFPQDVVDRYVKLLISESLREAVARLRKIYPLDEQGKGKTDNELKEMLKADGIKKTEQSNELEVLTALKTIKAGKADIRFNYNNNKLTLQDLEKRYLKVFNSKPLY